MPHLRTPQLGWLLDTNRHPPLGRGSWKSFASASPTSPTASPHQRLRPGSLSSRTGTLLGDVRGGRDENREITAIDSMFSTSHHHTAAKTSAASRAHVSVLFPLRRTLLSPGASAAAFARGACAWARGACRRAVAGRPSATSPSVCLVRFQESRRSQLKGREVRTGQVLTDASYVGEWVKMDLCCTMLHSPTTTSLRLTPFHYP